MRKNYHQYPLFNARIHKETAHKLKQAKEDSGLSWNTFFLSLLKASLHRTTQPKPVAAPMPEDVPHLPPQLEVCYQQFVCHRQEIRKPLTPRADLLTRKQLRTYLETHSIEEVCTWVERSIALGWQGIFPPKKPQWQIEKEQEEERKRKEKEKWDRLAEKNFQELQKRISLS